MTSPASTSNPTATLLRIERALQAQVPLPTILEDFCRSQDWRAAALWGFGPGSQTAVPVASSAPTEAGRRSPSPVARECLQRSGVVQSSGQDGPHWAARRVDPSRGTCVVVEVERAARPAQRDLDVFELFSALLCPTLDAMPTTLASGLEQAVDRWRRLETGSALAHELRNTLTIATVSLDLLADSPRLSAHDREVTSDALHASRLAGDLVKYLDAIEYARPLQPRRLRPDALVSEVVSALRALLPPEIQLDFEAQAELPRIDVDAPRLQLAIAELAFNARDAMPAGGILHVAVGADEDAEAVWIRVRDSGPGLLASHADNAFNLRFTTKRKQLCRGTGLSAVRRVVTKMGGRVTLTNAPDFGAVAEVRLPCATQASP